MILLSLSYLPSVTRDHSIELCRATGNTGRADVVLIAAAFCAGRWAD
jgi:hypothetical protein